jgi:hypothetical protein
MPSLSSPPRWIHDAGGGDLTLDDLDLVAELVLAACERA